MTDMTIVPETGGPPQATDVRQLDLLDYVAKLRHWMRPDAWSPRGNRLSFKNPEVSPSSIRMDGGHVVRMPLLLGRPCFGIATAYLRYRNMTRYVKGRGNLPTGRCVECKAKEACHRVVERRLRGTDAITRAWTDWLQYDGPSSFSLPGFKTMHVSRLWSALYMELCKHPFTSSNDSAVVTEYARRDAEKLKQDQQRKEKARLAARKLGVVDDSDLAALDLAHSNRRLRLLLASMHPRAPKELTRLPEQSIVDLLDVWLGQETLRLRREKPNAPNIARWIDRTGRSNRSKNHDALASRVAKDLKRVALLERVEWTDGRLLPALDPKNELPSAIAMTTEGLESAVRTS